MYLQKLDRVALVLDTVQPERVGQYEVYPLQEADYALLKDSSGKYNGREWRVGKVRETPELWVRSPHRKFWDYRQNNSFGFFIDDGIVSILVLIEADTAEEADTRAQDLGIYFDGLESGRDCECCGSRWTSAYDSCEDIQTEIRQCVKSYGQGWGIKRPVVVHFKSGPVHYIGEDNLEEQLAEIERRLE